MDFLFVFVSYYHRSVLFIHKMSLYSLVSNFLALPYSIHICQKFALKLDTFSHCLLIISTRPIPGGIGSIPNDSQMLG